MSFVIGNVVLIGDKAAVISDTYAKGFKAVSVSYTNVIYYITADIKNKYTKALRTDLTAKEKIDIDELKSELINYNDEISLADLPDIYKYDIPYWLYVDNVKFLAHTVRDYICSALIKEFKGL